MGSLNMLAAVTAGVLVAHGLSGAADPGPEPATLSLRQALERVAAGNVDLRRQNIALRTSAANVVASEGAFDFVLGADGSVARRVSPQIGPTQPLTLINIELFDVSLARALESGGKLTLAASGQKATTVVTGATSTPLYSANVNLTFTQPLLQGFGREIAEADLRKKRILDDQAQLSRQAQASISVRDAIIAYWELAYQTQDLQIRRDAEALAREQLRITELQIKVGKMGELQAAAARRAIAQAQQDEATSQQQLIGRALDLQRLFGVPVPRGFGGFRAAEAPSATAHEVSLDDETTHALAFSPALRALRKGLEASAIDLKVAVDALRPQLSFSGMVGRQGRKQVIGDTLGDLLKNEDTVASAGLVFSMPLQNRVARGQADAARATGDSARLDAEDLDLAIRDGVARFGAQIRSAGARIEFARAAVGFAEQNLTSDRARFEVGTATNNDVLLRLQELEQARIAIARAVVDLLEADASLAALTGDLLETYGLSLRP
jgi:outer membrane protein